MEPKGFRLSKKERREIVWLSSLSDFRAHIAGFIDDIKSNQIIFDALRFAYNEHDKKKRDSGELFISHPVSVLQIIAQKFGIKNPLLLSAALLHDVIEDKKQGNVRYRPLLVKNIECRFGKVAAQLVDGCSKMSKQRWDRVVLRDLTHRKIFLSASRQAGGGVLIIKLADRLHNIQTIRHKKEESKRRAIAQETIDIYAPIAAHLNIYNLKRELIDLAIPHIFPKKSKKIINLTQELLRSKIVNEFCHKLKHGFSESPHAVAVRYRLKGFSSYYSPTKRTLSIGNAKNQLDFTLIVDTANELDCYSVLGITNQNITPVRGSIRDYITVPKKNGYKSIHVRANFKRQNFLIKIRTVGMDNLNKYGYLHQWKMEHQSDDIKFKKMSEFLRNIGEYNGTSSQRKELIQLSWADEICAYTPEKDIQYLPKGSTVLDFAYRIHTKLGEKCVCALVNGQTVPLTYVLKDEDTVKIITSKLPPDMDPDLETLCKTPKARNAINKKIKEKRKLYAEKIGKDILFQEMNRHDISESVLHEESVSNFLAYKNYGDIKQLFICIGQDACSPLELIKEISKSELIVQQNNILIAELEIGVHKFAKCCKPYPGENNVVAALSERGVAFHRDKDNCNKLQKLSKFDQQKLLKVNWDIKTNWKIPLKFDLRITGKALASVFPLLADIPPATHIHRLESGKNVKENPTVSVSISFKNFWETQSFFKNFDFGTIIVENFQRNSITEAHVIQ